MVRMLGTVAVAVLVLAMAATASASGTRPAEGGVYAVGEEVTGPCQPDPEYNTGAPKNIYDGKVEHHSWVTSTFYEQKTSGSYFIGRRGDDSGSPGCESFNRTGRGPVTLPEAGPYFMAVEKTHYDVYWTCPSKFDCHARFEPAGENGAPAPVNETTDVVKFSAKAKKSDEEIKRWTKAANAFGTTANVGAVVAGVGFAFSATGVGAVAGTFGATLAVGGFAMQGVFNHMALDPPDPHFQVIAKPKAVSPPRFGSSAGGLSRQQAAALNTYVENAYALNAVGEAQVTSFERFQGAEAAGDASWQDRQLCATGKYAKRAMGIVRGLAADRGAVVKALNGPMTISPAEIRKARRQLQSHGLPKSAVSMLKRAGFTNKDVSLLLERFLDASAGTVGPVHVPGFLKGPGLAKTENQAAAALKQFATGGLAAC
jgi:hypothetical protein